MIMDILGKKAQGLPLYAIAIIILGLIVLAVLLIYVFFITGQGTNTTLGFIKIGGNVTNQAHSTATGFAG